MRLPLFFKILAGVWVTAVLSLLIAKAVFPFFGGQILLPWENGAVFRVVARQREAEADVALRYGGEPGVRALEATWQPSERNRLHIVGSGRGRRTVYDPPYIRPRGFGVPFVLDIFASLIFSAALAAYVTWPIGRIRHGFRSLADGVLDTRLGHRMGHRRDEITDLARDFDTMAERLQRLVSSRDRLLHDVSHELRSPLARMRVAMDLARQRPERTREALCRIEAEESRLNALIGDLLNLSRAESAPADEHLYFDLASLLEVVCADAAFEAQPRGVGVELRIAEALNDAAGAPVIVGDPELIRRAIENVVRNAVRFGPAGSSVQVDAHVEGERIVMEVRDSGPGAGPEVRAIMFEPFAKGTSATAGAGLGLAIAKRALIAHGGDIEAFEPEDGGMLVRMTLPPAPVVGRTAS